MERLTTEDCQARREELVAELREGLASHLDALDLTSFPDVNGQAPTYADKDFIRLAHSNQRVAAVKRLRRALTSRQISRLLLYFATGNEISPERIDPQLVPIVSESENGNLFRLATALWSIPVSVGYGRRMRFLVFDRNNGKLIGLFALMDPVFNLKVRDDWVGWTVGQRVHRLASVMDAYVLGSVPPYSQLLGGKLIASLIGSAEVSQVFDDRYGDSTGIISGKRKQSKLALVTVTSALGRSSLYNRLKLPGYVDMIKIGETSGWGHFHIHDELFLKMRQLLLIDGHRYADGHNYGTGPNWKIRVIRQALRSIGMDPNLLRHGISREVYGLPLASNWQSYLRGETDDDVVDRPSDAEITEAAKRRWLVPRSKRRPDYRQWTLEDTLTLFQSLFNNTCEIHVQENKNLLI